MACPKQEVALLGSRYDTCIQSAPTVGIPQIQLALFDPDLSFYCHLENASSLGEVERSYPRL